MPTIHEKIAWDIIDKYFKDNPDFISKHHLDSYNDVFDEKIKYIFKENNPITLQKEEIAKSGIYTYECRLYLGGKEGNKIYYGKPIIYDDKNEHYMYPNEARLRNMTYGMSIHYDVDVDIIIRNPDEEVVTDKRSSTLLLTRPLFGTEISKINKAYKIAEKKTIVIPQVFLGRFPIMLQSKFCILNGLNAETRYNMGECRNDPGGYFIIDGKEKVIVSQEKFGDNMLYVRDKVNDLYSHSVEIRTVSEDPSKPKRTLNVRIVAPTSKYTNNQIVVSIPNVRKPVPLFIVMRALGVISDKDIIRTCLLDLQQNSSLVDLFIPSIHDANMIFNQEEALKYIATFTKGKTIPSVMQILMNYFLPNIGELNFKNKAYYLGYMTYKLLLVYTKLEAPTDRDSYSYKRIEISGELIYDLFLEYYKLQLTNIRQSIDKEYYYHQGTYQKNFTALIEANSNTYFQYRIVEDGFKKGFKGNWGAKVHTKRLGVVQDLNRLTFFSFIAHLRKLNLPMDSSAKIVKPRLLHATQWGIIGPLHTPDGGNIGFHKHLSISAYITSGCSSNSMQQWLRNNGMKQIEEYEPEYLASKTKVFTNGSWIGIVFEPESLIQKFKLERRNGLIATYNSISWNIQRNEIHIYTDGGRLMRPIFYIKDKKPSYDNELTLKRIENGDYSWEQLISGFAEKNAVYYNTKCDTFNVEELYGDKAEESDDFLNKNSGIIDYLDTSESEGALIDVYGEKYKQTNATHIEIHPSLILSIMGNMIIYPENNQLPRDLFSCGQSKQAVSLYSSNYQNRIDKMGVVLNYGQIPLIKSRYLQYVTKEQHPYGENAIVAIMSYSGYNVEDALIFNESSIKRGLFSTTYFNNYISKESSTDVDDSTSDSHFCDVQNTNVNRLLPGYDYGYLDENGIIRENTIIDDKKIIIGKCLLMEETPGKFIDSSTKPKKGQKGVVDKAFITTGEEGYRIAKVRVRENRVPQIGDKFCSRAGQKGTVGIILREEDMPFTSNGIRPDIIVNPHAIPSRMTIGHLIETLVGKACIMQGGFGDCTAFVNKGPQHKEFGELLVKNGYNSTGNELLYNGMTGEQLEMEIFFGPNYYLRLKHMVKDKINYRSRGPRTALTRQPVHGRAKDGGLRVGEMDRDALIAHGMSRFLQESMLERSDDFFMAVCNKTGVIAIYNESQNLFLSPLADGPITFSGTLDDTLNIENISKFGKDFSIVRVPYTFKLLLQELKTMNVSMRIITEDNINQLTALTYNTKQIKLNTGKDNYEEVLQEYKALDGYVEPIKYDTAEIPYVPEPEPSADFIPHSPEGMPLSQLPIELRDHGYEPASPAYGQVGYEPRKQSMPFHRVAIIVPFRHQPLLEHIAGQNRLIHKEQFLKHMKEYIYKVSQYAANHLANIIHSDIYIIEQSHDDRKFNRGALLNSGFLLAMQKQNYGNIIFHDIDLLPQDNMIPFYSQAILSPAKVTHLAHNWGRYKGIGKSYIGGVTLFKSYFFNDVNGFPNYFEGWGGEDDAIRQRIISFMKLQDVALSTENDETILTKVINYPVGLPDDGFTDLENISDYKAKRAILDKNEALDNKVKREGRALDKKIWQYNGLRYPASIGWGALYTLNREDSLDAQYTMLLFHVSLNGTLTNISSINSELGSLSQTALDILELTPKLKIVESYTPTEHVPLSPVFNINGAHTPVGHTPEGTPPTPAFIPHSPAFSPHSPAFSPHSPAFSPHSPSGTPAFSPHSPSGTPAFSPHSPAFSPHSPSGTPAPASLTSGTSSAGSSFSLPSPQYSSHTPPVKETEEGIKKITIDTSDIPKGGIEDVTDLIETHLDPMKILDVKEIPKKDEEDEADGNTKKIIT